MLLLKLFTRNPFRALKRHMAKTTECAFKTRQLFEALLAKDKQRVHQVVKEISQLEHECDRMTQKLRFRLTQSVFLPVERRDLFGLLHDMDDIADTAEDIGVLLSLRWMELPPQLQDCFWDFLENTLQAVQKSKHVVDALEELFESGFSGPESKAVLDQIDAVGKLEHQSDKKQEVFGRELFAFEDALKPAALFMWLKIGAKVGDLANCSEHMVGHVRFMLSQN
ncbi:MAG: TIGR00153 family protein [Myxococcota bacterium]